MSKNLPPWAPRYRSWLRLQKFMKNPIPFYKDNLEKYGDTYCFSLRYSKVNIMTVNPDIIQHVLRKNRENYEKPIAQTSLLGSFMGKGLLLSMGEYHDNQRKLMSPGFRPKALNYLIDLLDSELDAYLCELDEQIATKKDVDISEEMKDLTFRLMSKSIFSDSMDRETIKEFSKNFNSLQEFFTTMVRMPFLMRFYNLAGKTKAYEEIANKNKKLLLDIIADREKGTKEYNDLLAMLMAARYEDTGKGMSPKQLQEESLILFVAGHETAANILSWIFYLLHEHPESVAKISAEYDEKFEDGKITFEGLMRMEYLSQFINECLRLYPPSWITDRVALEDDHIAGFDIPKGARVIIYIYGLHHSDKVWDEPEKFNPERFTKAKKKERHNFAHMPFGAGPRQCIGRNFAMMEMQMIILKFIQKYKLELVKNQRIDVWPSVTLRPRHGIKMNLYDL